jgi:hypothetical protein
MPGFGLRIHGFFLFGRRARHATVGSVRGDRALRAKPDLLNGIKLIWAAQPPSKKYFCFSEFGLAA